MPDVTPRYPRRKFVRDVTCAGLGASIVHGLAAADQVGTEPKPPDPVLRFPGPWAFNLPKGAIILVSDQQLEDLQDPDREVDLSLSSTPHRRTLRQVCREQQAAGAHTLILAFDHFWAQYRPGQGDKPRVLMPDTDAYIEKVRRISDTLKAHGLGLELSLLSPLELGPGYRQRTGENGRWVQYREGLRDPKTGRYEVQMWEHRRWTNNKGSIDVKRSCARLFAFRERRVGGTPFYAVNPAEIVELREPATIDEWEGATVDAGGSFAARCVTVRGAGETQAGALDRVLVVLSYETPEMDYFSPKALPFLKDLVERYHRAGIPLNGLYSDEMHIQQDWAYFSHHDEGQFTLRFLTPNLARAFAGMYGAEFADLEKFLVYFCYGQHGFLSSLDARLPAQHVLGASPEDIQRTFLLRRRYYDLLDRTVVGLFTQAREHAEQLYGHALEARAHATWAQSPTIDSWYTGATRHATRQYEYTPNFQWSNTVQQAASACDDYFRWNDFLTGGGNDHAEGGWSDRDYYALALACSTGILNRVPYAYAAHWGMPGQVAERRQALVDAYGAAASPAFQAIEGAVHRDVEVLMLYPLSLVACEERFGSWMTQYGYANYVTPDQLVARGRVTAGGAIEMAGRRFTTVAVLFEPLPPAGLLAFLEEFAARGGRLVWSGPPPRLDLAGANILEAWRKLFGVASLGFGAQGGLAPGELIQFEGPLKGVPPQTILTHLLVDHVYAVEPGSDAQVVARLGGQTVGLHRHLPAGGAATFLGFRPRDDQSASLGYETRTWFEVLRALGAYPPSAPALPANDHPCVVSRESPHLACRFPDGTLAIAAHYCRHVESWPGGFHRNASEDEAALARNPLPSDRLDLAGFSLQGFKITYRGRLVMAFRVAADGALAAFGGYDCAALQLGEVQHRFADRPMAHLAWAPVAENRRVPGGAVLELWAHGEAELRLPLSGARPRGRLFFHGSRPGSLGEEVPVKIENGHVLFSSKNAWPVKHLYLL